MTTGVAYRYRAASPDGAIETGSVYAPHRDAVREVVGRRGLLLLDVQPERAVGSLAVRSKTDEALALRLLARLLAAGLPVHRALAAFEEIAPRSWMGAVPAMRQAVREGAGLAAALASTPRLASRLTIALMEAGEAGAGLARAASRAAELAEDAQRARAALLGALAYPALLSVTGTASLALLVGVVLPRFAGILGDLGQQLPASTRFMLRAGSVARASVLPLLAFTAALLTVWSAWVVRGGNGERWAAFLLRVPLLGRIRLSLATSRAADALAALLGVGLGITAALPYAARAAADEHCAAALLRVRERLLRGESVCSAIALESAMSPAAIRLIRAGEDTGRVAAMLEEAARLEREQAAQLIHGFARAVEPVFILVFGALVAFAAVSLLQALYGIRPV